MFSPIKAQNIFPGNNGDGISREADVNNRKKTKSIIAPFTRDSSFELCQSYLGSQHIRYRDI